jgi:hypothetical protein
MKLRSIGTPAIAFAATLVSGCFGYYDPATSSVPVTKVVQLALTDSGSVVLASKIGPSNESVEGRLVADSSGVYLVSLSGVRRRDGSESDWRGEQVAIPRELVSKMSERRFSRGRTILMSALTTTALIAATKAFQGRGAATPAGVNPGTGPK